MLSSLTSLLRPAESHTVYPSRAVRSGAPRWCHQLIEAQANGRCISPFTNIPASLRVPLHLHRDAYLAEVQRASAPQTNLTWMSGQGQDWWVWYNHARFLNRSATYIDLAANDAIWRSNTYFFDACLHWQGLLIEPNPEHYARLRRERSGTLVPSCVSNTSSNVSFHQGLGWRGGSSKILPGAARPEGHGVRTVQCRSLQSIILEGGHRHIDFLSLDVEGHEVQALERRPEQGPHRHHHQREPARRRAPAAQRLPPAVERARQHLAAEQLPARHHAARRQGHRPHVERF